MNPIKDHLYRLAIACGVNGKRHKNITKKRKMETNQLCQQTIIYGKKILKQVEISSSYLLCVVHFNDDHRETVEHHTFLS